MNSIENQEDNLDFEKLGLKCGLELHQQLATKRKLFCRCSSELRFDSPQTTITRYMRPTLSELGEYDKAALMEFKKQKIITYEVHDTTCTYEIDETPPFAPDPNAIDLAITIARLLQMEIIDELHINRKQYLDGSIPTGFQRTMIVGYDGKVKAGKRTYNLDMLALEEDSCREISDDGHNITWRVDRLGTPLVEIATKTLSIKDPEEVRIIAETIGRILRATGKVKRGLGTIRQDLNISIKDGARVELKGVQTLDMLSEYVTQEVIRQISLLEIKDELLARKLSCESFDQESRDCLLIFKNSKCKFIIKAIKAKEKIIGVKLPGMKGLLGRKIQGERSFGKEIADRVKIIASLGGIIHTDELPNYGITQNEKDALISYFNCKENDAVAFVIGNKQDTNVAIKEILIRAKESLDGVPIETRHANEDGTSQFERYLGGAGRMYPDTDTRPIVITKSRIKQIDESLPELPDEKEARYIQDFNLPEEIAKSLTISPRVLLFETLVKMNVDPKLAAVTLEQTIKSLSRDNLPVENLTDNHILNIFNLLLKNKITKEAIEPLLLYLTKNPKDKLEDVIEKLNLIVITEEELIDIIHITFDENMDIINELKEKALKKLMGYVMAKVRGKIDGKIVNQVLENQLEIKLEKIASEK